MSIATPPKPEVSMSQVHQIVKDCFQPKPAIYWTDFLLSMIGGLVAFSLVMRVPAGPWQWPLRAVCYIASVILYYRAALFIHEIVHFRENTLRSFRLVWNLLCGIPFLMPTFMYYTHSDHHVRKHFATHHDGEYLPLAGQGPFHLFLYLLQPFYVPLLAILRYLVIAPISWLSPTLRRLVFQHASSMVIDFNYIRPMPTRKIQKIIRLQELGCVLFVWAIALMVYSGRFPNLTAWTVLQAYFTSVGVLMLNHVRTLGAHRYTNLERRELTFVEQLLDSVNYPNHAWLAELAMPVGLRFHALHHLCPAIPYHALGKAHRKLMAELPGESIYRRTVSPSLMASLGQLWRACLAADQAERASCDEPHDTVSA